ncbi:polysaccharide biosynthesis/export family protein [Mariniradius sp. RY-2]|uniref:Polysaccharide biosynthesis/export family protein n=2 Tax=Mariniradius sediminis TaxID=2909237 RepID=A0ABS9BQR0_9BACT|nr:polysaccharide biosynthesis/export family protein [Mariniradius sediminis]MCF1750134.1 polysaccharide biosynthesis/export family protein [Mariniradius sediminis]
MQDLPQDQNAFSLGEMVNSQFEEYLLQYNDVVEINIKTPDPLLNQMFDINSSGASSMGGRMMMGGMMNGGDIFYLSGYTLNDEGFVELPVLGKFKLVGLTADQAKELIEKELEKIVRGEDNFVRVRLGGIRYSALGEFARPGKYTILQNRVTIFEAIANAGDLTVTAKRDNIMLIRQYPEGSKVHRINLNHKEIMTSDFYFLRPNDMIYAEPMKVREIGTGVTLLQTTQLLISLVTVILLVYTTTNTN